MNTIFSFILVLGLLIFVHELGHFLFAKLFGVRVLKFSLGFGPRIAGKQIGETEYVISEEKKNNSYLYEPVAALAPMVLPNLVEEVENIDIPKDILDINKSEKEE